MKKKALGKAINGEFRMNIGKHVLNGKVAYKQFRLGKDPATAERLVTALQTFWENETAKTSNGEKVWSQQGINAAFKLVIGTAPAKQETQTNASVQTPALGDFLRNPKSAANGSLMRNAPVAAMATSLDQAFEFSLKQSIVTHYGPLPVVCCCCQSYLRSGGISVDCGCSWETAGGDD